MADEKAFFSRNAQKLFAILVLTWAGCTFKMIGETLREIAALIFIFVPLELWRDQSLQHASLIEYAAGGSAMFFIVGVCSEYISGTAYRFKRDLEGRFDSQ